MENEKVEITFDSGQKVQGVVTRIFYTEKCIEIIVNASPRVYFLEKYDPSSNKCIATNVHENKITKQCTIKII